MSEQSLATDEFSNPFGISAEDIKVEQVFRPGSKKADCCSASNGVDLYQSECHESAKPTETDIAKAFLPSVKTDWIFIRETKQWARFRSDKGWEIGALGDEDILYRKLSSFIRALFPSPKEDDFGNKAKEMRRNRKNFLRDSVINSIMKILKRHLGESIKLWDANPNELGVQNGVVFLPRKDNDKVTPYHFEPHRREHRVSMRTGCKYEADAECLEWKRAVNSWMCGNGELVKYLHKVAGSSLSGGQISRKVTFNYGTGANGKSQFSNAMTEILGSYSAKAPRGLLTSGFKSGSSNEINVGAVEMRGKRLLTGPEVEEGESVKLGLLKDITGDDEVSARRPYDRGLTVFRPACTIFVNCNEPPRIPGGDLGTWSRVWFVPWKARFEESSGNRVEDFGRKLATTEGSGILNWLLKGLELALEEGIDPPDAMIALQQEIRESEDPLHLFAQECLEPAPPNAAPEARRVSNKELWGAWRRWCEENGLEPGNTVRLSKRIRSSDSMIGPFKVEKSQWRSGKIRGYVGVRLARRVGASPRGNPTTG